jgi:hypothetical protein
MICSLGLVSPGERHDIMREIFGGSDGTRTRDLLLEEIREIVRGENSLHCVCWCARVDLIHQPRPY